jgi:hypothetical protein
MRNIKRNISKNGGNGKANKGQDNLFDDRMSMKKYLVMLYRRNLTEFIL